MLRDVKNTNLHLHTFGMAMERDLHISLYNTASSIEWRAWNPALIMNLFTWAYWRYSVLVLTGGEITMLGCQLWISVSCRFVQKKGLTHCLTSWLETTSYHMAMPYHLYNVVSFQYSISGWWFGTCYIFSTYWDK